MPHSARQGRSKGSSLVASKLPGLVGGSSALLGLKKKGPRDRGVTEVAGKERKRPVGPGLNHPLALTPPKLASLFRGGREKGEPSFASTDVRPPNCHRSSREESLAPEPFAPQSRSSIRRFQGLHSVRPEDSKGESHGENRENHGGVSLTTSTCGAARRNGDVTDQRDFVAQVSATLPQQFSSPDCFPHCQPSVVGPGSLDVERLFAR